MKLGLALLGGLCALIAVAVGVMLVTRKTGDELADFQARCKQLGLTPSTAAVDIPGATCLGELDGARAFLNWNREGTRAGPPFKPHVAVFLDAGVFAGDGHAVNDLASSPKTGDAAIDAALAKAAPLAAGPAPVNVMAGAKVLVGSRLDLVLKGRWTTPVDTWWLATWVPIDADDVALRAAFDRLLNIRRALGG